MNQASHWEQVYQTKKPDEVSWTQLTPEPSLQLIQNLALSRSAPVIDIGGGDSLLVDFLLKDGFTDITVLDISKEALSRAQQRLGDRAKQVQWIVADITTFKPERHYALWHDRAAFHFLTYSKQIEQYVATVTDWVQQFLVIGTFSTQGPHKCSGLDIRQYTEQSLSEQFSAAFESTHCLRHDHQTPFGTSQNFVFCSFTRTISA